MPLIWLLACPTPPSTSDTSPSTSPDLVAEDTRLVFADTRVGQSTRQSVRIWNHGDADARIVSVWTDDVTFQSALSAVLVPPGGWTTLQVDFTPQLAGDHSASAIITGVQSELGISLEGTGLDGLATLSVDTVDFGEVPLACSLDQVVTLRNGGNDTLDLAVVDLASPQFTVAHEPMSLAPGDAGDLTVTYTPNSETVDTATLTVGSETSTASVVLNGTGTAVWHTDSWTQTAAARDILVAMGGSSGMIHRSPGAFSELELLLATVLEAGTDVRLSMVTEDDGCIPEPVYIDAATTDPDQVLASFCGELDGDRCTGTGSDQERGFTLLESALMAPCNGDWLREDADLALVSISDEGEHSVNPYTYYVALFQSLKDEPEYVRLHAVGGDYPTGCSDVAGYVRMYEATVATGGTFHSMCEEWGETLGAELADVSPRTLVALSHEPVPDSVSITIDGTASTAWTWHDDWTIALDTPPDPGVEVLVTYRELPACP